jgi:hypothetical protein
MATEGNAHSSKTTQVVGDDHCRGEIAAKAASARQRMFISLGLGTTQIPFHAAGGNLTVFPNRAEEIISETVPLRRTAQKCLGLQCFQGAHTASSTAPKRFNRV